MSELKFYQTTETAYINLKAKMDSLEVLQKEHDECQESCDIITHKYLGKEEPSEVKESWAKFNLRKIAIQKQMRKIILGL